MSWRGPGLFANDRSETFGPCHPSDGPVGAYALGRTESQSEGLTSPRERGALVRHTESGATKVLAKWITTIAEAPPKRRVKRGPADVAGA